MTARGDMTRQAARYDGGTIALHWLTAVLVLGLWLVGTFLEDLVPKGTLRSGIWSAHFDLGFVLTGLSSPSSSGVGRGVATCRSRTQGRSIAWPRRPTPRCTSC